MSPPATGGLLSLENSSLASRSDKVVPVSGQCFSLLVDSPFRIFAQVGYTIATARWYCMPVEWEPFLHADAVSIEMEACPATGYVARLDSIGFYEVDLLAEASSLDSHLPFPLFPSRRPRSRPIFGALGLVDGAYRLEKSCLAASFY
jgi:hypothetical protein